jgi:hypothetical protein
MIKSFLPSTTNQWKNLTLSQQGAQSISLFKKGLQTQNQKHSKLLYVGPRKLNIIHAQLRNNCSRLNADLYARHMVMSPKCKCGSPPEKQSNTTSLSALFIQWIENTSYQK